MMYRIMCCYRPLFSCYLITECDIFAVLEEFCHLRLEFYCKRKVHVMNFVIFRILTESHINQFICAGSIVEEYQAGLKEA